jgi:GxxExxY protein
LGFRIEPQRRREAEKSNLSKIILSEKPCFSDLLQRVETEESNLNKMDIEELNKYSGIVLDSSIEVHRILGPGLLESVYEICLAKELVLRGLKIKRQVTLPVIYKNEILSKEFCIDILIEDELIVEIKTVEKLLPIHEAQLLTYLKLTKNKLGLLINFNSVLLKDGFKRIILSETK